MDTPPKTGTRKTRAVDDAITNGAKPAPSTASSASQPPYGVFEQPSDSWTGQYARPIDARSLAGQITTVATGLLNGEYAGAQLDVVRLYAGMVRSIAQLMTAETSRARQARQLPDLTLPDIDEDQEDADA